MIKRFSISFPHATTSFGICCDNVKLTNLLEMYYGSMFENVDKVNAVELCYLNEIFCVKKGGKLYNAQTQTCETAFCSIVAYIRNNIHVENDWFLYHGSCSVVGEKVYLFIGSSMSGKTTLTTFLEFQPKTITVTEDLSAINFETCEIESINRPFFLRPSSFELLQSKYNIAIPANGTCTYNVNEKIIANFNSIIPNVTYKIDEILFLCLREGAVEKKKCNEFEDLLYNSYNANDITKSIYATHILASSVPMFKLYYYDLNEVYNYLLG